MDFIDLKSQQKRIKKEILKRIKAVLSHGRYILGPEVAELEEKLAGFVGVKHAIGCASGTDALLMALMALKVGPGDAVFTTPFTFVATAEVISLLGATPIFVDINPSTYNVDPEKLEQAIKALKAQDSALHPLPRSLSLSALIPRGIIPVDLFGLPADYDAIEEIARKHNLFVVEDAAQSFGAQYKGKKACAFGNIACTSFFPAKPLGAYGDGGMCFTDDDEVAELIRSIRVHGQGKDRYENVRLGINGRLDTIQAAILLAKFEIFPEEMALRQRVAENYLNLLKKSSLILPQVPEGCTHAWAQFSICTRGEKERQEIRDSLSANGIPTAVYYPTPLHLQPAFAYLGYRAGDFPISEDISTRIFSLPMHPYLPPLTQKRIQKSVPL